jgi:cobalt/nickel transport system permease protein
MSGAHLLASYAHLDSPLHRARASTKLLGALALVTALAFVPASSVGWSAAALALLLGLAVGSRVPLSAFAARLAVAQPFVLGIAVLALFQGRGLSIFFGIALKSTACVAALQLLGHTTHFEDMLEVLRRARLPPALILALSLLHRYLHVLVEESQRMRRARAARTWTTRRWGTWAALSSVIAASLTRSMARAERVSAAMQARGGS